MPLPTPVELQATLTRLLTHSIPPSPEMATKRLTLAEFLIFKKKVAVFLTETVHEYLKEVHPS
jgi:hypothetical protein